jgi:hypothetical protein
MMLTFYHAVEIINPSQGAVLMGSRRGVVADNYNEKFNFCNAFMSKQVTSL